MVRPRGFRVEVSSVFGIFWSTIFVCASGCIRHGEYMIGGSSLPNRYKSTPVPAFPIRRRFSGYLLTCTFVGE